MQSSYVAVDDEAEKQYYWQLILKCWRLPRHMRHFPASSPVSIERKHFDLLQTEDFLVSLKTDGVRHVLLLTMRPNTSTPISIFVDRTLGMYEVELWASEHYFANTTLFDGELVATRDGVDHFVIFDAVQISNVVLIDRCYRERLRQISSSVLSVDVMYADEQLEHMLAAEDGIVAHNNKTLLLVVKQCLPKQHIDRVWISQGGVNHDNDGLVFTRNDATVETGTASHIFKWKPTHSVDIRIVQEDAQLLMWAHENDCDGEVALDDRYLFRKGIAFEPNTVVECTVTCGEKVTLEPLRRRPDKTAPNTMRTIEATVRNVGENISIDELIALLQNR